MRFTNIISAAALAIALGVSGAATAATLVGNVTVTDIDLPRVQAMCDQMVSATADAVGEDLSENTANDVASTDSDAKGIDDITLQDCIDAGLLPEDTEVPEIEVTN
jgi:hypothetical protein